MARINLKGYFLVHVVYEMWAASLVWEYEYSNAFDYLIELLTCAVESCSADSKH